MTQSENTNEYNPAEIEPKWQEKWEKEGVFEPEMKTAPKPFYNLMMFPYPSAEGLHIGNLYAFCGADIYGRFKRMQGFDVFEPIGLDGFGIHSENYALKVGRHPIENAKITEEKFYQQLRASGNAYAFKNILETYDPDYYKWTQWLFIQMFKKGLAYKAPAPVNFCPSCKTVLADEQAATGVCERCGTKVEIKKLEQWFFRITKYADRLLANLKILKWPQKVLLGQKNWIGQSKGAEIIFKIDGRDFPIHVFTTRVDTTYGVTALVLAPDKMYQNKNLAIEIATGEYKDKVKKYIKENQELRIKNQGNDEEKTGVFTGAYGINPFSGEKVPVWVANYVVGWYGTGALMVVPAHDERDFEFAKKYNLPIKKVIKTKEKNLPTVSYGVLVDSGEFTGLSSEEAMQKMISFLEDTEQGKGEIQYKLRDWIISRQRYWGAPIPMIFCEKCDWQPVPESDLPVLLPNVSDWKPKGAGVSPLAGIDDFVNTTCPKCGEPAVRETDVCDTFLDSSWYYLRYPSVGNQKSKIKNQNYNSKFKNELNEESTSDGGRLSLRSLDSSEVKESLPWDEEITSKWLPVTKYIGGAEHTVLHLLYSRFVTMALHDMKFLEFAEPFPDFFAHGLIIKDGAKMSKSKGNVVIPDLYIKKYGVDSLRCYLMFLGPFEAGGDFRDSGMHGMHKFLKRIWKIYHDPQKQGDTASPELKSLLQTTIKKATADIAKLKYNTLISGLMEFMNQWEEEGMKLSVEDKISLLKLLAPLAPHIAEEIFQESRIKNQESKKDFISIHKKHWPEYDENLIINKGMLVVIQVNGKKRGQITVSSDLANDREQVIELALKEESVKKYIKDPLQVKKSFYVPGRLVSLVV